MLFGSIHAEQLWPSPINFSLKDFRSPSLAYAPFTRWWWPGNDVTPQELKREVQLFAEHHIGGVEIQPMALVMPCKGKGRADRIMTFDTPAYYQNLAIVLQAAKQNGITVDLTDGSGWPAGGAHISEQENNKTLEVGMADLKSGRNMPMGVPRAQRGDRPTAKLVAVVIAQMTSKADSTLILNRNTVKDITSLVRDGKVAVAVKDKDYKLLAFWEIPDMEKPMIMANRNAGFAMNHFDSTVVAKNYEHYLGKRTGLEPYMGAPLRALFNDSYEFRANRHFTDDFITTFEKNRGYNPIPFLPANIWYGYNNMYERMARPGQQPLFAFDSNDWRLRYDYDLTISDLLRQHFLRSSKRWLESRGMLHRTQTYGLNMDMIGAAGDASIPEVETMIFSKACEAGYKLISSGAHLYNRPIVSCEAAIYFGRAFLTTPQKLKITIDKVLTSGVNQLIWHGTPYSYFPEGYPKEGWYPFFNSALGINFSTFMSEKNPFWPEFRDMNIYAQRAQYLLRCGKPQADVLIYYPFLKFPEDTYNPKEILISGYLPAVEPKLVKDDSRPFNSEIETKWLNEIWPLINDLNARGITWDWVNDESLLAAQVNSDGNINIRDNRYQGLILWHLPYMQLKTAQKLPLLAKAGARVWVQGALPKIQPSYYEWQKADSMVCVAMRNLSEQSTVKHYDKGLSSLEIPFENKPSTDCFRQIRRTLDDGSVLQMYWNESEEWQTLEIKSHTKNQYYYWLNAEDGKMKPASLDDNQVLRYTFSPLSSIFLLSSSKPLDTEDAKGSVCQSNIQFTPNQATLLCEMPQWTIHVDSLLEHKKAHDEDTISKMAVNYDRDNYTLADWRTDSLLCYNAKPCIYTLTTKLKINRKKHYFLDLGQVCYVALLSINGQQVGKRLYEPYLFDVTPYLRCGNNTFQVTLKPSIYNDLVKRAIDGDRLFKSLKDGGLAAEGLVGPVRLYEQ
jgi:hypothetical protein